MNDIAPIRVTKRHAFRVKDHTIVVDFGDHTINVPRPELVWDLEHAPSRGADLSAVEVLVFYRRILLDLPKEQVWQYIESLREAMIASGETTKRPAGGPVVMMSRA